MSLRNIIIKSMISVAVAFYCTATFACTSAIISAELNPYGRPILWKHRDTSTIDNKVEYIAPHNGNYGYVALFNANDKYLKEAWMGMNDVGFAIMNTASYNIKDDKVPEKLMDKEGILMSKALQTCKTLDDFAILLENYPKPMGVEANFGVIDAYGNGAYFETNNNSYVKFDIADSPEGILIRTNYSHSGRKKEGYGYIREANAEVLLQPYIESKSVTPEVLTEIISRTFYHDGMKIDNTMSRNHYLLDEDYIPRYKSTATIAIEGSVPIHISEDKQDPDWDNIIDQYIMWTGIGYPPVAEIRAVRCNPQGIDPGLQGSGKNGHSSLGDKAKKIRNEIFKSDKKTKKNYLDISKLYNTNNTGYAQQAIERNKEIYKIERAKRNE